MRNYICLFVAVSDNTRKNGLQFCFRVEEKARLFQFGVPGVILGGCICKHFGN